MKFLEKHLDISITVGLFILGVVIQQCFFYKLSISTDLISNLIVFLSIVFGFCATSLAIFSTSRYMHVLYETEDSFDSSKTLLHTLVGRYKAGLTFALITVLYLLILQFRAESFISASPTVVSLSDPFSFFIVSAVVVNFYFGFSLMSILSKVVIQEGKRSAE
jgi:hypothetical protein